MNAQVLETVDSGTDLAAPQEPAAPAAPEPAPAAAAPAAPAPAPEPKQDLVPLAALHEARQEARQLKQQIAALEAQPKLTAEDAELLRNLRAQRSQEADPDFLQDPKGYVDTKLSRALKKLEEAQGAASQTREQVDQQRQLSEAMGVVQLQERAFAAQTPDYNSAVEHVRSVRAEQLKLLYPSATDAQIGMQIRREEMAGALQALQAGVNPAEMLYKYAKTVGYAPKQAAPAPKPDASAVRTLGSNGGAAPNVDEGDTPDDGLSPLRDALKERFGVRR